MGYHEKASNADLDSPNGNNGSLNWTIYGDWYGLNGDYTNEDGTEHTSPWCAMFVSWCADQAGIPQEKIAHRAGTQAFVDWYKEQSRFEPQESDYIPKVGDIVMYQWYEGDNKRGHVGIIVSIDSVNRVFYSIEGNKGDQVRYVSHPFDYERISGYGLNGGKSYGTITEDMLIATGTGSTY